MPDATELDEFLEQFSSQADETFTSQMRAEAARFKADAVFFAVEQHPDVRAWRDAVDVAHGKLDALAEAYMAGLQKGVEPMLLHQSMQDADVFEAVKKRIIPLFFPSPPIR